MAAFRAVFFAFNFFIIRRTWTLAVAFAHTEFIRYDFNLTCPAGSLGTTASFTGRERAPDWLAPPSDGRFLPPNFFVSRQSIGT